MIIAFKASVEKYF